jgi:hypothetical protein
VCLYSQSYASPDIASMEVYEKGPSASLPTASFGLFSKSWFALNIPDDDAHLGFGFSDLVQTMEEADDTNYVQCVCIISVFALSLIEWTEVSNQLLCSQQMAYL